MAGPGLQHSLHLKIYAMTTHAVVVVPPFYGVQTPSLGATIVKSIFESGGYSTRVLYANVDLWGKFPEGYDAVLNFPHELLVGEWIFSIAERRRSTASTFNFEEALSELVLGTRIPSSKLPDESVCLRLKELFNSLDNYLDFLVAEVVATAPAIVAFSSSFHQTSAAVAIARRIKKFDSSIITIIGGANAEGNMATALLQFGAFDVVYSGQAEFGLHETLIAIKDGGFRGLAMELPAQEPSLFTRTAIPDYSDYFELLDKLPLQRHIDRRIPLQLPLETSRGCWWGQTHHCTFCGLNGSTMEYRKRTGQEVVREVSVLSLVWQQHDFNALDNIMPTDAMVSYMAELHKLTPSTHVFFETKANFTERRLDELFSVGVRAIQPGIEALSTRILHKIDKGLTAVEAIRLLRDCESRRIRAFWNAFTEIPNDDDEDYEGLATLVEKIQHLQPPTGFGPIRVDRFSPYFERPSEYNIQRLDPFKAYSRCYEGENIDIRSIAYHFEYERSKPLNSQQPFRNDFISALKNWKIAWDSKYENRPRLRTVISDTEENFVLIEDTRPGSLATYVVLDKLHMKLLAIAWRGVDRCAVHQSPQLDELLKRNFIAVVDEKLITLITDYGGYLRQTTTDTSDRPLRDRLHS